MKQNVGDIKSKKFTPVYTQTDGSSLRILTEKANSQEVLFMKEKVHKGFFPHPTNVLYYLSLFCLIL